MRDDPSKLKFESSFRREIQRRSRWLLAENHSVFPGPTYTLFEAMRLKPSDPSSFGWYQRPTTAGEYSHDTLRAAKARFTRMAGKA